MSVEINVASFTDSSVIQLAGDQLADYGGIFITAGGKVRFKYKQNDNFFENEVDITLNTWHRVEQFRVKLVDKVLRKLCNLHQLVDKVLSHFVTKAALEETGTE